RYREEGRQQADGEEALEKPEIKLRPLQFDDFDIPTRVHVNSLGQAYNLSDHFKGIIEEDMD
ncbi:hypothetical protein FBU59_004949, partial [Linderina macrospora]